MLDKEFITIDSHCHAGESWYEPIESLRFHLDESQINKAVLIGHMGAYQNNDYLLECKNNFPDRFAVVGVFNLDNALDKNDDLNNINLDSVDIGVYKGVYSFQLSKISNHVHSFEPNPLIVVV